MRGRGRVHKTERWHAVLSLVRGEIPNGSYWVESQMPANDSIRSEPYLAYPGDNTFKKTSLGDSNRNAFEKQNHRGTRQTACRLDFGKQLSTNGCEYPSLSPGVVFLGCSFLDSDSEHLIAALGSPESDTNISKWSSGKPKKS